MGIKVFKKLLLILLCLPFIGFGQDDIITYESDVKLGYQFSRDSSLALLNDLNPTEVVFGSSNGVQLFLFCDSCNIARNYNSNEDIWTFSTVILRKENDFKSIYKNDLQNKNEDFIITYTKLNTDNYVISGKTGNTIYYQKSIYREDGIIITAELEYPSALKEIGNNMASLLYKSLKFNYGN